MALKLKKYLNSYGVEVEEGYFEIYEITRNFDVNSFDIKGRIFFSKEARENGFRPIDFFEDNIQIEDVSGDYREFAYNYILDIANKGLEYIQENCPVYKGFIGAEVV